MVLMVDVVEVDTSQCIPSLWVVLDCLPDNSPNNDLAASGFPVSETKQACVGAVSAYSICDVCVMSLDRFVCVAWMPVLSINAAKL